MEMDTITNDRIPEENKNNCSTNSVDSGENFHYELKRVNKATVHFLVDVVLPDVPNAVESVRKGPDMVSYKYSFDIEFDNYLLYIFLL